MASSANINIFTDEGIDAAFDKVPIDKSLQTSLISKASLARLHDPSFPASSNRSVVRSSGNDYTVIGTIKLSWHKREADKSYLITFSVIESTSHLVILGRNALPEESGLDVRPLGLEPQAEAQKRQQERKKQDEQAKRDAEKKEQADKEKEKQASQSKAK